MGVAQLVNIITDLLKLKSLRYRWRQCGLDWLDDIKTSCGLPQQWQRLAWVPLEYAKSPRLTRIDKKRLFEAAVTRFLRNLGSSSC